MSIFLVLPSSMTFVTNDQDESHLSRFQKQLYNEIDHVYD